ncbi:MAG: hypothetical protein JWO13_814 [Acidobacteriales bacterium]|nr:hypothetical protein [Terriglobales bacterium]
MLKTPEHLQKQFGIPAAAGQGRAIPRVLLAYSGPRKKQFLATAMSMIVAGALPEHGQNNKQFRLVSQEDLAGMCDVSRSTFTRRVSLFADPDSGWSDAEREKQSERQKAIARIQGKQVHNRPRRSNGHAGHLVNRRRRFAEPNRYSLRLPTAEDPKKLNRYIPGTLRDIKEDAGVSHLFNEGAVGFKSWDSFKDVPRWVWDHRLPLSDSARLVFSYYVMCGLLDKDGKGHVRGEVHPKQSTVALALGMTKRTVYAANRQLEKLSLIRVAHPKPIVTAGQYVRGPAKIIYLPVRQLSHEEATAERERYSKALASLRDSGHDLLAAKVHRELLDAWEGKEHCLGAFWNELRRRLADAGVDRQSINGLVPRPPE